MRLEKAEVTDGDGDCWKESRKRDLRQAFFSPHFGSSCPLPSSSGTPISTLLFLFSLHLLSSSPMSLNIPYHSALSSPSWEAPSY